MDTTLLRSVVSSAIIPAVTGGLTALGALVLMGLLDVVLFGVTLGAVGCIVLMEAVIVPGSVVRSGRRRKPSGR